MLCCSLPVVAGADDDAVVAKAKMCKASDFDNTLPAQPVEAWLRAQLSATCDVVWGESVTDCGESSGSPDDAERDMPMCAEVEIREGGRLKGYLALLVGTRKSGLVRDGIGLYFGYLEQGGTKYDLKKLSDILWVK